jgi:hypothetical protein
MTATVVLSRGAEAPIAKLPLAAVMNRGTGPSVYVIDEANELVLRPVTVASFTGDSALMSAGLEDGERVVTLGVQKLDAGQNVRILDER